jgi:hypothetical protein
LTPEEELRLKAELDSHAAAEKARVDSEAAAQKALVDEQAATQATRVAYDQAYFAAMLDAAKGSLDRANAAAELVQKAAAAIGTLYAGILGVTFSVSGRPLPQRGIVPAIFLGAAIVMSMVYLAYNTPGSDPGETTPSASPPERLRVRLTDFFSLIRERVQRRAYSLKASVIALGFGVLFLPAPFIAFTAPSSPDLVNYPWPTRLAASDARQASLDEIVFKAQVDEVVAERQRAGAGQAASADRSLWVGIALAAFIVVLLLPLKV